MQLKIKKDLLKVISWFLIWRVSLFLVLILAIQFLPRFGNNFFGGGLVNYQKNPYLFAWANFDGEHYLSIAEIGYRGLEQAFFPIYPLLMRILASTIDVNAYYLTLAGILISTFSTLGALVILFRLIKLDYNEKIAFRTILSLLLFPTSFYLGAVYTESLFLLLIVGSFYFARKGNFFFATLLGIVASATRVFGVLLLPALLIEVWQQNRFFNKKTLWLFLIPLGFLSYMFYQWLTVGDPLAFYHLQLIVGPQHQSGIILFPQVVYRYIKILITLDFRNTLYPTMILELFTGLLFFALPIYGFFKKVRLSYLFFAFFNFLAPTIQGSFSSLPRYILVFFPSFLALAVFLSTQKKLVRIFILSLSGIWLVVNAAMFFRGYWVA